MTFLSNSDVTILPNKLFHPKSNPTKVPALLSFTEFQNRTQWILEYWHSCRYDITQEIHCLWNEIGSDHSSWSSNRSLQSQGLVVSHPLPEELINCSIECTPLVTFITEYLTNWIKIIEVQLQLRVSISVITWKEVKQNIIW